MNTASSPTKPGLVRAIGRWDLVAFVINGIVGAGIFGLPAKVHALLGAWGTVAIVACAALMGVVIACFAEVSSRFSETGGPFLYATEAFGPFAGFMSGWLLWLARVTGICAIAGVLCEYMSYFLPSVAHGAPRALFITAIVGGLSVLHISGVQRAARFGNVVTIAKLAPLVLFVMLGLPHVDAARFDFSVHPSNSNFSSAVLLLAFAFVGWEGALVAAGELREPRRDMPFALAFGLIGVVVLYVGINAVCVGTLPGLATSGRPLADAASQFMGPAGATMIVLGAAVSMLGTINGGVLAISRIPFAMSEAGQLPRWLSALHPRFRTPVAAIVFSSVIIMLVTISNSNVYLLTVSTTSRLLVFAITCAALPKLRRQPSTPPALFTIPGGVTLPVLALALVAWLIASTSWKETRDVLIAAAVGVAVLLISRTRGARATSAM